MSLNFFFALSTGYGLLLMADRKMKSSVFRGTPIFEPPRTTTIVLPTFNEALYVKDTLRSLEMQSVRNEYPDRFEVLIVDSHSTDNTTEIASKYGMVLQTPKGKLTAKDIGIRAAKGDVIMTVDADTYYPPNYLNLMLRHFSDPVVVAVTSPRLVDHPVLGPLYVLDAIFNTRIRGSNAAFRKSAYFACGGHDLTINQLNGRAMLLEEEYNFGAKLGSVGDVILDRSAPSITSTRRFTNRDFQEQVRAGVRFKEVITCDLCNAPIDTSFGITSCSSCGALYKLQEV